MKTQVLSVSTYDKEYLLFDDFTWSIKQNWYDNIPEHGVLCWVHNAKKITPICSIITKYRDNTFVSGVGGFWDYAEPLTNKEIKQFLREE